MLIALWSAKGGSGTSVFTAACALVLAREGRDTGHAPGARVADLAGDLPAVFGVGAEPTLGVADWLAAGPAAPTDALDRLLVEVTPGVGLLPRGGAELAAGAVAAAEAGAALAVALRESPVPTLVDCGTASDPASRAVIEVADVAVVVLRGCYLALRRAVHGPVLASTTAAVLLEEPGRTLSARDVAQVFDLPVLARVPVKSIIARSVDAGVLATRLPESLARSANDLLRRLDPSSGRNGAAA